MLGVLLDALRGALATLLVATTLVKIKEQTQFNTKIKLLIVAFILFSLGLSI